MIGIVGNRAGFREPGGVRKLVELLCRRLEIEGIAYRILTAGEVSQGEYSNLIVVGCSSPWAYGLALKVLVQRPAMPIHWIPCFHPPRFVTHRWKARLALWALRGLQRLGVRVYALTQAEQAELNVGRCGLLSLPFDCEETFVQVTAAGTTTGAQRPFALVFLGRPVAQKGWPQYLAMVNQLGLNCLALVPFEPEGALPPTLTLRIGLNDRDVREHLRQCRLLILPSDYESFGFAQAEALLSGCCVPVLGEWPLWLGVTNNITDNAGGHVMELDWRNLTPSQSAERARSLLMEPAALTALQHQQLRSWMSRPERQAPILPNLRAVDAGQGRPPGLTHTQTGGTSSLRNEGGRRR